jgi:hypothetical protein
MIISRGDTWRLPAESLVSEFPKRSNPLFLFGLSNHQGRLAGLKFLMKEAQMTYRQILPLSRSLRLKPYKDFIDSRPHYTRKDKKNLYLEHHHICPRSFNGSDEDWNMIWLTAQDHFISHKLLALAYDGTRYHAEMWRAFNMMVHCKNDIQVYRIIATPEEYSLVRIKYFELQSNAMKGNVYTLGRHPTKETRIKMHDRLIGNKNALGNKLTDETRLKMICNHPDMCWVYKKDIEKSKYIFLKNLNDYLRQGYTRGRMIKETITTSGWKWFSKNKKSKFISPDLFKKYQKLGWMPGRCLEKII